MSAAPSSSPDAAKKMDREPASPGEANRPAARTETMLSARTRAGKL
jgi:hypothetical protein